MVRRSSFAKLVERLRKASTAYGMETSAEKTTLMTNKTNGTNTEIKVNGQKLETVTSFKYLGSDRNLARAILIRHNTLFDVETKVCLLSHQSYVLFHCRMTVLDS